jgi:beta-glucanase (GH16 family)
MVEKGSGGLVLHFTTPFPFLSIRVRRRVTRLTEHSILSSKLFTHRRKVMSFFSHLRSWPKGSLKVAGSKTRPVRYRPLIEELEARQLLSTTFPTPIFNEDFNQTVGSLPLSSTWTYNTGSDPNNTAVHYVDDASTLSVVNDPNASDGKALAMTIYPTNTGNQTFNSARINTSGNPGGNVEYGLIEARIKLPGGPNGQGDGLWPAFWMLGSDHQHGVGWPNCGEIDVMEQGGARPSINVGSTHFGSLSGPTRQDTSQTYTLPGGQAFYSSYHTFAVYWTPGSITFSVDGNPYSMILRSSYSSALWDQTFHQPFYMILNICDGGPNNAGGFGGPVTQRSTFPQTMYVDYVRAYSLTGIGTPTNFTATAISPNEVNLSWQDPANDETSFVLQRSKTADFASIDASVNLAPGTTTYQDTTGSPGTTYYYRLQAVATDGIHTYQSGYSNATATTAGVASADLALNRPVFASSVENSTFPAGNAVDGNSATRWSSQFSDLQWIYVDLGATYKITEVKLNWERAAGKNYQIQVSADAFNWTTIASITGNTTAGIHDYTGLSGTGRYVRIYGTARATPYGYSLYDFNVYGVANPDLALNRPVVASSLENGSFPAANAVDGNSASRWSSQFSDPQWIYVDLGATFNITEVKLNWERAAGKNYLIQVSADAINWTTIATITGNTTAGMHDYTGLSGAGRYVRIYGTARATPYGYSLYDFNVYAVGVASA